MNIYRKLLEIGTFTKYDVLDIYRNSNSVDSAISTLINKGLIKRIKKNLYVCCDIMSKLPVADKFKIGCSISKDAYISHYSALEFHGLTYKTQDRYEDKLEDEDELKDDDKLEDEDELKDDDKLEDEDDDRDEIEDKNKDKDREGDKNENNQEHKEDSKIINKIHDEEYKKIEYEAENGAEEDKKSETKIVYVSSKMRFESVDFSGHTYQRVTSQSDDGVINDNTSYRVRVTNIERTIIDCIKDINKAGGIEEFLSTLFYTPLLDNEKLMQYLKMYDIQFLYQKAGFIFEQLKYKFDFPQEFEDFCRNNISKSKRYLLMNNEKDLTYIAKWKLLVAKDLILYMEHGCDI